MWIFASDFKIKIECYVKIFVMQQQLSEIIPHPMLPYLHFPTEGD